ncbi:MAG: hypothetical protein RMJ44_08515 [Cytophagales bacterium]|nr:hypothetical protein [Bernardetiaceae bacterium]MDW8211115.1 hypothetical protein [Cytophagales bacterium]
MQPYLRRQVLLLVGVIVASFSKAQWRTTGIGVRAVGMANAAVAMSDEWAAFNNIGGLAWNQQATLLSAYDNRFQLAGFQTVVAGLIGPVYRNSWAAGTVARFGDPLFNETIASLGASHKVANYSIGVRMNYIQIGIEGLGTRRLLAFETGGVGQLTPQLWIGAHIFNFNQARLADFQDERLPTIMKIGISYRPHSRFILNLEGEKDILLPPRTKVGLEYRLVNSLALRTGIATQPHTGAFGLSLYLKKLEIGYALAIHQYLLPCHHLALRYQLFENSSTEKTAAR